MRVLLLTPSYPTPQDPINGIFVREYALAAAAHADVSVLHLARGYPLGVTPVEGEPVPTWRSGFPQRPAALGLLVAAHLGFRRLPRPDVVHAQFFLAADAALLVTRAPLVTSEHWGVFLPEAGLPLSRAFLLAARFGLGRSREVLPVSRGLGDALRAHGIKTPFTVVPNAVDERLFHAAAAHRRHDTVRLLAVGRLSEEKRVDVLLRAAAALPRDAYRLEVVGDGPLRPELELLAEELGIAAQVTFAGLLAKDEVAARMRDADVFVLSSRFESNGVVVLEALSSGLPVVASDVGPLRELIDASNGALATAGDPAALAVAIEDVAARLDGFDRAAISAAAHARYGREAVGRSLAEVYRRARRPAD